MEDVAVNWSGGKMANGPVVVVAVQVISKRLTLRFASVIWRCNYYIYIFSFCAGPARDYIRIYSGCGSAQTNASVRPRCAVAGVCYRLPTQENYNKQKHRWKFFDSNHPPRNVIGVIYSDNSVALWYTPLEIKRTFSNATCHHTNTCSFFHRTRCKRPEKIQSG